MLNHLRFTSISRIAGVSSNNGAKEGQHALAFEYLDRDVARLVRNDEEPDAKNAGFMQHGTGTRKKWRLLPSFRIVAVAKGTFEQVEVRVGRLRSSERQNFPDGRPDHLAEVKSLHRQTTGSKSLLNREGNAGQGIQQRAVKIEKEGLRKMKR